MTEQQRHADNTLLFSVVVPAYNSCHTISECLLALLSQPGFEPGRDFEIIVVDDGSDDDTVRIAAQYPVRVLALGENRGRIMARKTGAEAARANKILLVDTRVIVSHTLFDSLGKIGYTPLMTGDLGENVEEGGLPLLFFMLKRWYYRPYFPQTDYGRELWIDKDNFYKAPKGAGCLLIDRELFLDAQPEKQGKNVNDDTRLFEYVVMTREIKILRHTEVAVRYVHREDPAAVSRWLFGRGVLFSDFVLFRRRRYLFLLLLSVAMIVAAFFCILFQPLWALGLLLTTFAFYLGAAIYLARTTREFCCALKELYKVAALFWAGSVVGLLWKFRSASRSA